MSPQSHSPDEPVVWYPALSLTVSRLLTAESGNLLSTSLLMAVLVDLVPQPARMETHELVNGDLVISVLCQYKPTQQEQAKNELFQRQLQGIQMAPTSALIADLMNESAADVAQD